MQAVAEFLYFVGGQIGFHCGGQYTQGNVTPLAVDA